MTDADREGIDPPDDGVVPLGCEELGQTTWDYGAIGPDDKRGRVADDSLRDALADLEASSADVAVPAAGWVELQEGPGASTFVAPAVGPKFAIVVRGDVEQGVWRHQRALICADGS